MSRKWPAIDVVKLYTEGNYKKWNQFLAQCHKNHDVTSLKKTLYGIQAGMSDATKKHLNSPEIVNLFLRLQRSLEKTAQTIFREKYPNPLDDPLNARKLGFQSAKDAKRKRDNEFEQFLKDTRF